MVDASGPKWIFSFVHYFDQLNAIEKVFLQTFQFLTIVDFAFTQVWGRKSYRESNSQKRLKKIVNI